MSDENKIEQYRPQSGRMMKEDGTVVNIADAITEDGALKVDIQDASLTVEGDVNVDAVTINNPVGNPVNVKLPEGAQATLDTNSTAIKTAVETTSGNAATAVGVLEAIEEIIQKATIVDVFTGTADDEAATVDFGGKATALLIENTGSDALLVDMGGVNPLSIAGGDSREIDDISIENVDVSTADAEETTYSIEATIIPAEGS